jgi:hypothetical protein
VNYHVCTYKQNHHIVYKEISYVVKGQVVVDDDIQEPNILTVKTGNIFSIYVAIRVPPAIRRGLVCAAVMLFRHNPIVKGGNHLVLELGVDGLIEEKQYKQRNEISLQGH